MGTAFDTFAPSAHTANATGEMAANRQRLKRAMEAEGFTVYEAEWWHFDYRDWREYPILNLTFEQLG